MNVLWQERFLTREQLKVRVEGILGQGCFGKSAWQDTFYRDMRFVKHAFQVVGFQMSYCRGSEKTGYYLINQPSIEPNLTKIIDGSVAEVDPAQIAVFRGLSLAQCFCQGCDISNTARKVVAYRIQQTNPALSQAEANHLALQRKADI